ncbi:MAG: D-alanyl-D-alaninecarboxypeptidase/D-alanyl-D-al anine-endopeptidase, partial [Frankiales bacterium]|nr:D-alanyl-D-alaninecarboxypeptidase/D-alanyl-D-al anine-endopeptidase [Frankiales bacterium]
LVGGGDPTLASGAAPDGFAAARLPELVTATVAALRARGQSSTTIGYDAGAFTGPALAPGWKPVYVTDGDVSPVVGLMVDGGRVTAGSRARSADPAKAAAQRFAALLAAAGVRVTGKPRAAVGTGPELASVQSPPLTALIDRMLALSDNDIAESLARHVAIQSGAAGSFAAAGPAVAAALEPLGVAGVVLADGSGLSRADRVTPAALASIVRVAAQLAHPELRSLIEGLPISGFTGTMAHRFGDAKTHASAGLVRAKTGTLNNVTSLAGTVVDSDGRLLVFAFISNRSRPVAGPRDPRQGLDALVAVVAACGCR